MKLIFRLLFAALFIGVGYVQAEPILVEEAGVYIGAKGIQVGNKIYDVQFRDGKFVDLFSEPGWIPFANKEELSSALNQLHDLITSNNELDANPWYARGCGYAAACMILTPVSSKPYDGNDNNFGQIDLADVFLVGAISLNDIPSIPNFTSYIYFDDFDFYFDTDQWAWLTWADWSVASTTVPEPSSWMLMLSMLCLCFYRHRSKLL